MLPALARRFRDLKLRELPAGLVSARVTGPVLVPAVSGDGNLAAAGIAPVDRRVEFREIPITGIAIDGNGTGRPGFQLWPA